MPFRCASQAYSSVITLACGGGSRALLGCSKGVQREFQRGKTRLPEQEARQAVARSLSHSARLAHVVAEAEVEAAVGGQAVAPRAPALLVVVLG